MAPLAPVWPGQRRQPRPAESSRLDSEELRRPQAFRGLGRGSLQLCPGGVQLTSEPRRRERRRPTRAPRSGSPLGDAAARTELLTARALCCHCDAEEQRGGGLREAGQGRAAPQRCGGGGPAWRAGAASRSGQRSLGGGSRQRLGGRRSTRQLLPEAAALGGQRWKRLSLWELEPSACLPAVYCGLQRGGSRKSSLPCAAVLPGLPRAGEARLCPPAGSPLDLVQPDTLR